MAKFRTVRKHTPKASSANALALKKEIQDATMSDQLKKAEILTRRYKKRYGTLEL